MMRNLNLGAISVMQWVLAIFCVIAIVSSLFFYSGYVRHIRELKQSIDQQEQKLGTLQSQIAFVETSITDNQSAIDYLVSQIKIVCDRKIPAAQIRETSNRLNLSQLYWEDLSARCNATQWKEITTFLRFYNQGLIDRLHVNYPQALKHFERALSFDGSLRVNHEWRARAEEGRAYALMKMNRYDEAKAANQKALDLYDQFVFAGITKIKLMCVGHEPKTVVQAALVSLRQSMAGIASGASAEIAVAKTQDDRRGAEAAFYYAKLDRSYIESDGELFTLCRYAGITAEKP